MAYELQVLVYQSDFTTADETNYTAGLIPSVNILRCEAITGAMGGCLGAVLELPGGVRDDFTIDRDQFIEIKFDSSTLVYSGYVAYRERIVETDVHRYEIRGLADKLVDITVSAVDQQGADVGGSSITTVGGLVDHLASTHVDGTDILYDATLIVSTIDLDEFEVHKNADLNYIFTTLAYMASSGGAMVTWGVRPDRKFYFLAISTDVGDLQDTVEVGTNCLRGIERSADEQPINQLVVIADVDYSTGYVGKKTYTHASASTNGPSRIRACRVGGIVQEADMTRFANGYFTRWADPGIEVKSFNKLQAGGDVPPEPWTGQIKYTDTSRGDLVTTYTGQIRHIFGLTYEYEAQIGIGTPDDIAPVDAYAPSIIDDLTSPIGGGGLGGPAGTSGGGGGGGAGGGGWADILSAPDVTDETSAPTNYPHLSGGDIPYAGRAGTEPGGGGGASANLARGQVVQFDTNGGAVFTGSSPEEDIIATAMIANGGAAALAADAVTFYFRHLNEAGSPTATTTQAGTRVETNSNIETFTQSATGYEVPAAGWVQVGIRIKTSEGPPIVYSYYPNEDTSLPDYDNCKKIRVVDPSGDTLSTGNTVVIGWGGISGG